MFFLWCEIVIVSSLDKRGGYSERSKSRSRRKNLFPCNLDVSSEITPVEVSQKMNMDIKITLFMKNTGGAGWDI
jgi:hypothetical protein